MSQAQTPKAGYVAGPKGPAAVATGLRPLLASLTAGVICGLLVVVFSISDAALLFNGALSGYVAVGIGLCLFSSAVLAAIIACSSSHPGMIGLSQEVTVVTLAVIAASMHTAMEGLRSEREMLVTIVVAIGLATSFTGLCLLALGVFRLGRLIRFIPYPVIGGFLAGMGWLIVQGAFGVILGETPTLQNLAILVEPANVAKWAPATLFACILAAISQRGGSAFSLPAAIAAALLLFHATTWVLALPLSQLQAEGWLFDLPMQGTVWPPFTGNPLDSIDWGVIWAEVPKVMAMVVVTAASVLLASSGIELSLRRDIDLDRELRAAGLANFFAGTGGGAAGFQGLGLSLLGHKLGGDFRLVGLVVAAICVATLFFGSALLAYMPIPLFGGLLLWIGISLLYDWLVEAFFKMPRREYLIILLILLVIGWVGFLEGVLVGVISAVVLFTLDYSRVEIVKYAATGDNFHSSVERAEEERRILVTQGRQILILRLQGYVFFGTAHRLQKLVRTRMQDRSEPRLRFLLLDCRSLTGLDSSAVLSFIKIGQRAERNWATVVVTNIPDRIGRLLNDGGFGTESGLPVRSFPEFDRALEWCEERLLEAAAGGPRSRQDNSIEGLLTRALGDRRAAGIMQLYLEKMTLGPKATLIHQGEVSSDLFFVESGRVSVQIETPEGIGVRLRTMGMGTIVGEIAFYLDQCRSASVVADTEAVVWRLSRDSLARMKAEAPDIASAFHEHLVRMLAARVTQTTGLIRSLAD
ncbi:SLC26A/SulP transporter family protein [Pelagibius litoralis]|uniref:SLC26A/SulP transporter family protein n=1 Tax=Pelagibius litoralis TaxID=374515 RepID=A0A967EYR2_9PROT|nr:SulP family inorganic anion transporter [Pelagibius litoralis]NIA69918.1 SLC26A/SulP transporter family protein [Pelagibius litoralis]